MLEIYVLCRDRTYDSMILNSSFRVFHVDTYTVCLVQFIIQTNICTLTIFCISQVLLHVSMHLHIFGSLILLFC
jgi:hypothetical protein